ncbi:hypothetical protein C2845_PM02G01390 [Panicum miliaceum]|uniref:DUF6598 domain-containing protein n=1 Tax=Panicum miliaceum TaxID=4540 RepID=A0A3L6S8L5_PANMI|nr:hypothetical protein C2845_PM02G01390 [Panicum miliaceum]
MPGEHVLASQPPGGATTQPARIALPLDTIPDSERDDLDLALNIIHLKVLASDVGFPGEMLAPTGPNRGPFESAPFYFEISLKIRGEEQTMDRIFSRSLITEDYPLDQWTRKQEISSWLSTLEFAYRSVHYAVEATVGINILRGPRKNSTGAW